MEKSKPPKSESDRYLESSITETKREPLPMNWPASMNALFAAFDDFLISVKLIFCEERMVLFNLDTMFLNVIDLERITRAYSRSAFRTCILHGFRMAVQFSCLLPGIVNFCPIER
jgi:hypothetical protein